MKKPLDHGRLGRSERSIARADYEDHDEPSLVATSTHSVGLIQHDDLGRPRWAWMNELGSPDDDADEPDLLDALDTSALSLADEPGAGAVSKRPKETGYDPYDTLNIRMGGRKLR